FAPPDGGGSGIESQDLKAVTAHHLHGTPVFLRFFCGGSALHLFINGAVLAPAEEKGSRSADDGSGQHEPGIAREIGPAGLLRISRRLEHARSPRTEYRTPQFGRGRRRRGMLVPHQEAVTFA